MMLAVLGGLIGCALGLLADGWTASSIVGSGQGGGKSVVLKMTVDATVLLTGMLLALGMGLIGGLVPALTAMSSRPLEAVR
jgi:putative ABC transport system permease protein